MKRVEFIREELEEEFLTESLKFDSIDTDLESDVVKDFYKLIKKLAKQAKKYNLNTTLTPKKPYKKRVEVQGKKAKVWVKPLALDVFGEDEVPKGAHRKLGTMMARFDRKYFKKLGEVNINKGGRKPEKLVGYIEFLLHAGAVSRLKKINKEFLKKVPRGAKKRRIE